MPERSLVVFEAVMITFADFAAAAASKHEQTRVTLKSLAHNLITKKDDVM